jgi:signal transduction histidine kinase/DNA-binding response OmpR family regulator
MILVACSAFRYFRLPEAFLNGLQTCWWLTTILCFSNSRRKLWSNGATTLWNNFYAPCILHDMLRTPSLAGRACARLDAGKRMIHRFRHGIIGPLAIFWLIVTVASVVSGAVAWSRFSRRVNASAEPDQFRESINHLQQITWMAGLLGVGAGLFALYFYRLDYHRERERRELLEGKLHAEQAVREKSAFLANMSHEIRSPMNAILGFSELLEPEGLTSKQSQYVRAIRDSGASLLQLINDILDLSKLEAGRLELHPDPTDMRDSCEFLRTVFAEQAVKKSLQLQFEVSPHLPRALLLDRLRLRQVMVNLLGNAVKFTDAGCVKTRISWQGPENGRTGTLLIDVEDTGIGIAADKLEEVFQPFVQADSRRTAEREGTGMGLTIVKRVTELMGGTLEVESAVGQGTIFHLRFPDVPVSGLAPVGDHAEPGGAVDFNDFAPASVLVADDNQANRALMAGIFERTHHRLHFANNGQDALDQLKVARPDVILLDIRMPVMDGRTTLAEIRKQANLASLPIIAVTASSEPSEDTELRGQFSGFIRKPFSRHTLFLALAQFLQKAPVGKGLERQNLKETFQSIPIASADQAAQWQELALELRRQVASEWPTLRDSLAVNETRAFAHKLFLLSEAAHCGPLAAYAATLTTFTDSYAIGQMEHHLAVFPKLVESIDARSGETERRQTSEDPVRS